MKFVCKYLGGSHLYGLATPSSDVDERGVYLSDSLNSLWGFAKDDCKVTDNGVVDKCFFEFQRFLQLLKKTNTNSIECLFAPKYAFSVYTPLFEKVQENSMNLVTSKKLLASLMGYVHNERRLALGERTGKLGGKRREQLEMYGFSPKNVSHMLRLSYCAEVFFKTGEYPVVLEDTPMHDLCYDLKVNPDHYSQSTVEDLCNDAVKTVENLEDTLQLTFDNDLAVDLLKEAYRDLLV